MSRQIRAPYSRSGESNSNRQFIRSAKVEESQKLHFFWATIVPISICTGWFFAYPNIQFSDACLLLSMWTLTGGLGISLGYHRYFTHSSFTAHPFLRIAMAISGSMAAQGPLSYWVAVHRCHHKHSDSELDPHTPRPLNETSSWLARVKAFFRGHVGWVVSHDVPSPVYFAKDLLKDPTLRYFDRSYRLWVLIGILGPGLGMLAIDGSFHGFLRGCVFGGLLRVVLGNQIIWAINSVCHTCGDHQFDTKDDSTNNWLLSLPSFGEGWHNNHHAFPWSARFGLQWWQFDFGWLMLRFFSLVGLASELKQPSDSHFQRLARLSQSCESK